MSDLRATNPSAFERIQRLGSTDPFAGLDTQDIGRSGAGWSSQGGGRPGGAALPMIAESPLPGSRASSTVAPIPMRPRMGPSEGGFVADRPTTSMSSVSQADTNTVFGNPAHPIHRLRPPPAPSASAGGRAQGGEAVPAQPQSGSKRVWIWVAVIGGVAIVIAAVVAFIMYRANKKRNEAALKNTALLQENIDAFGGRLRDMVGGSPDDVADPADATGAQLPPPRVGGFGSPGFAATTCSTPARLLELQQDPAAVAERTTSRQRLADQVRQARAPVPPAPAVAGAATPSAQVPAAVALTALGAVPTVQSQVPRPQATPPAPSQAPLPTPPSPAPVPVLPQVPAVTPAAVVPAPSIPSIPEYEVGAVEAKTEDPEDQADHSSVADLYAPYAPSSASSASLRSVTTSLQRVQTEIDETVEEFRRAAIPAMEEATRPPAVSQAARDSIVAAHTRGEVQTDSTAFSAIATQGVSQAGGDAATLSGPVDDSILDTPVDFPL